jgi:hypothetical protein
MSIAMKDSDPITLDSVSYITDSEKNMGWLKGVKHYG